MTTEILFHWHYENITPRLVIAVGTIILEWAMIDAEVTSMLRLFWTRKRDNERPPKSFDRRVKNLIEFADDLYGNVLAEPDEQRVFRWYIQRLRCASGRRDDIAHGMPGTITQHGRTYEGLQVPHPVGSTRFVPFSTDDIIRFVGDVMALHHETREVSHALYLALMAASPGTLRVQTPDGFLPVTKENRGLKLPRWQPPPPTFRG
jgi:hypothetical protein